MNQYPREIAFMHGNMQHRATLIDNTQEPLNNSNNNNNDFSNCFICHQPAMSKPFYILDNTGFIIHASCTIISSARTIAGEHNRNILPSHPPHPPFNLHHQPPQYMNHYHSPPPNYNYLNGNFNVPYLPPYFNLHQQPPQCMNYSYSAPPPHYVNCSNAPYNPPPYPYYVGYPPPPPPLPPQNIHNNHHHGYGGMLGILGTSVVGNIIEAFFDNMHYKKISV